MRPQRSPRSRVSHLLPCFSSQSLTFPHSATPARSLSRKRSKSVVIHEDEAAPTPPVPALPTEAGPTPKSAVGHGKRVLQPSTPSENDDESVGTKTPKARGRPPKIAAPVVAEDSGADENAAAEVKKPKAVRKALKKPGEPLPTRALRSRG